MGNAYCLTPLVSLDSLLNPLYQRNQRPVMGAGLFRKQLCGMSREPIQKVLTGFEEQKSYYLFKDGNSKFDGNESYQICIIFAYFLLTATCNFITVRTVCVCGTEKTAGSDHTRCPSSVYLSGRPRRYYARRWNQQRPVWPDSF